MISPGTPPADLPQVGLKELLLWACRLRQRVRIDGDSMRPLLEPNDEVLIDPRAVLAAGDLVLARHPFRKETPIIKWLRAWSDDGGAYLEGINPQYSTDSRSFGAVPRDHLLGKVTSRF